jgi:hypothetical protein
MMKYQAMCRKKDVLSTVFEEIPSGLVLLKCTDLGLIAFADDLDEYVLTECFLLTEEEMSLLTDPELGLILGLVDEDEEEH